MGNPRPHGETSPSSGRIQRLPDGLVDQIAAGEVIERPASVLKELVENALDAGAQRVRVELRDGGASLIAVSDDGFGMTPEEARMALQRHATSKITRLDDLGEITSFGFRGEALPAIASVSRMRVLTRPESAEIGAEIRIESGEIIQAREAGCPAGTRIEVADLFGRVPARRKFLKKPGTEWGHAIDWLGRLAMALPMTHFEVQRDDHEAVVWPATEEPSERISAVLGASQTRSLVRIEWEEGAGHVEAFLSGPETTRANGNSIHLYVNGRPVRDKLLRHAVSQAYRDLLPRGRFPVAVVFLTVPPGSVDVNVHPAKWEVRFENPQAIHQVIRHAVREAMQDRGFLGANPLPSSREPAVGPGRPLPGTTGQGARGQGARGQGALGQDAQGEGAPGEGDWLFARGSSEPGAHRLEDREAPGGAGANSGQEGRVEFSQLRLLGQIQARYLVLEGEKGLILVDQHAAHERVLYEGLRAAWLERRVERQGLLVPETLETGSRGVAVIAEAAELVSAMGFDVEAFGESSLVIRAIPALLAGQDPALLVGDLIDELEGVDFVPEREAAHSRMLTAIDRAFATLACHSARRFGDHLPQEEQRAILAGLDEIPWAPTCPHGRPVAAHFDLGELDGRFGRH
ncbi:MAG: DNA mismatch repair endonuclease MutL [Myxococcota bacterium]|nr:DNA mismatch repair endonuclease MutL [Myxococcota bacterium]